MPLIDVIAPGGTLVLKMRFVFWIREKHKKNFATTSVYIKKTKIFSADMKVNMIFFRSSKYDLFHQFMSIPPSGILRTHNMLATHQKVKNSLTFHWHLNSFHWPFINEKQSMFTFALAFFAGHRYFSLHFQPLSAFRWKRKKEFGRKHLQRKPLTTTTTCVRR